MDGCSAKGRGFLTNLAAIEMQSSLSAHDAKCAEFAPEFRKHEKAEAGVAPRVVGISRRAAAYAGAERAAQCFTVAGELMPLFERAPDAAALVNHCQFDAPIGALLRAKNAAISFRMLEDVADDFAQAVGERRSHFELIALRYEPSQTFAFLMDHTPEWLSRLGNALVEFCSCQRCDGKPCCTARHGAGNIAHGDAEPLEEADMSEILVRRLASADTLRGDASILALPKKRTQRSADIKQAERFDAAKRSEVNRRSRCGNVGGQSGSKVERGVRIERRRQRDGVHAASYGVGVIASNPEALGPPVKNPRAEWRFSTSWYP